MSDTIKKDNEYIASTYRRFPIEITGGKGSLVFDANGKEYIDLGAGIAVNIFGMCDEVWQNAVKRQIDSFQHTSNLYYSAPCATLAKMLVERTGMKKVFFSNSGAEANECAIKAARRFCEKTKGKSGKIITLVNSFHGRTLATLAATGQDVFHKDFLPVTDGFIYAAPNDCAALERLFENDIAAVMLEIVQGEGGVVALDKAFVERAQRLCSEHGALLIIDEVQTGNGRTGALYAYMNYGVSPDIVTTAKGLGGGLPIGATMLGERVKDVFDFGSHGSTFGGNPIACAGAVSILERLDSSLFQAVKRKERLVRSKLEGAKGIKGVSGMGLMLGIETERPAAEVISGCLARGVMPIAAKSKVRLLPALNIPDNLLEQAVAVIADEAAKQ